MATATTGPWGLNTHELHILEEVQASFPDCDANFIVYIIKQLTHQSSIVGRPPNAPPNSRAKHRTQRRTSAGKADGPAPGTSLTSPSGPRPLVARVTEKVELMGDLYPRQPSFSTACAADATTTDYANFYLAVLNQVFPHWAASSLREWINRAVVHRTGQSLLHAPTDGSLREPGHGRVAASGTQVSSVAYSQGLFGAFPDSLVNEYLNHQALCVHHPKSPSGPPSELGPTNSPCSVAPEAIWVAGQVVTGLIRSWADQLTGAFRSDPACPHPSVPDTIAPRVTGTPPGVLNPGDYFRPPAYREGARLRLFRAFPMLYRSTVDAVLAENHGDFIPSYYQLQDIKDREPNSWFKSVLQQFIPGRPKQAEDHPSMYHLDLLRDVDALDRATRWKQVASDGCVAVALNEEEYERHGQLITCGCCYDEFPFERLASCTAGHLCCHDCLRRFTEEFIFGQAGGKQPTDDSDGGLADLRCIGHGDCVGCYTPTTLQQVLPLEILTQYDQETARRSLTRWRRNQGPTSQAETVVTCSACAYAYLVPPTGRTTRWWLAGSGNTSIVWQHLGTALRAGFTILAVTGGIYILDKLATLVLGLHMTIILESCMVFIIPPVVISRVFGARHANFRAQLQELYQNQAARRDPVGTKTLPTGIYQCPNPHCRRLVCPTCDKPLTPDHRCGESYKEAMKRYIDRAMNEAVKRTCPRCQMSFVKSDGCNKMTCRCGYTMCYVCRRDIARVSYAHFCQHFRAIPGSRCNQCDRCDLYQSEDEETARRQAAEKAKQEFMARHPVEQEANVNNGRTPMGVIDLNREYQFGNDVLSVMNGTLEQWILQTLAFIIG
ncbi:hypothetical protein IWQ60_004262 [Tieghemiomyces parasiticus]|uniref:RING-type domain-containing protein n=1 Tax=Tieghemiomyces parasiticus TaxID=78921 RepID=A0A9W8A966_9FUNG|nr:hypothetical protein IWQ60_004262 [Tieghemiomyces parasiticus]